MAKKALSKLYAYIKCDKCIGAKPHGFTQAGKLKCLYCGDIKDLPNGFVFAESMNQGCSPKRA